MAKDFKIKYLKTLLDQLVISAGESMDHYGLSRISEKIGEGVSHKYLYDNLYKGIEKAEKKGIEQLKLSPNKVDEIARFLQYENFNDFVQAHENPQNPLLTSLIGNYYSYVRKNSNVGGILESPVKISLIDNKYSFYLKGPVWNYTGQLVYVDGCLFCLMKSGAGKFFHHVYKIGKSKSANVIMGIFSGVSSANDPIGGRCVLVRQNAEFEDLANNRMPIEEMLNSENYIYKKLAFYFKDFSSNNLKINAVNGFDIDDL